MYIYVSSKSIEVIWAEDDLFTLCLRTWQFSQNIRPGLLFRNHMNFCCQNQFEYLEIHVISAYFSDVYFSLYLPAIKKAYRQLSRRPTPGVTACHVQIVTDCRTSISWYARLFSKLENLWRRTEENLNRLCQTSWDFLRLLSVPKKNLF